MNQGKIFEQAIKGSMPDSCWLYRLRDNAASFGASSSTRFSSSNICDYICFDDISHTLFLWELKSTQSKSMSFEMIRENQFNSLLEASKHDLVAGLICNFRNKNNDTFFIEICDFADMKKEISKKSFNVNDLIEYNAVRVESEKKRTLFKYNIAKLVDETHL